MTHASLFSGIGGAEIAATQMGWSNLFHCEINPFGRRVLEYWYPNSTSYEDITQTDFAPWRGRIDVLTAGFPCQPFSLAGSRKGADDDRYLWPQVVRAIREIRPSWVVGENVAGILTMVQPGTEVEVRGGASLFGEDYRTRTLLRQEYVVETICRDLEREGYSVQPFVIPACAVGAPHRRDRVWFVAHRADGRHIVSPSGQGTAVHAGQGIAEGRTGRTTSHPDLDRQRERANQQVPVTGRERTSDYCACNQDGTAPNPESTRSERECEHRPWEAEPDGRSIEDDCELPALRWAGFPAAQPVIRAGDDGIPARLDGITFPRWRAESIKALGNAWVPQVAYEIFRAIQQAEDEEATNQTRP